MNGWLAFSPGDLKAWADLTGTIVRPEEWTIIRDMEHAFLRASAAKADGSADRPKLTAAAFDAVFG